MGRIRAQVWSLRTEATETAASSSTLPLGRPPGLESRAGLDRSRSPVASRDHSKRSPSFENKSRTTQPPPGYRLLFGGPPVVGTGKELGSQRQADHLPGLAKQAHRMAATSTTMTKFLDIRGARGQQRRNRAEALEDNVVRRAATLGGSIRHEHEALRQLLQLECLKMLNVKAGCSKEGIVLFKPERAQRRRRRPRLDRRML